MVLGCTAIFFSDCVKNQTMESNRKRKARERNFNQEQVSYYKKLRKEQNKKRKQRKRGAVTQAELKRKEKIQVTDSLPRGQEDKKEVEELDRHFPRGKQMVFAALKSGSLHPHRRANKLVAGPSKTTKQELAKGTGGINLKELHSSNLKRNTGAMSIGSGTYGTCYPGKYCGIPVVIKM